MTYHFYKKQVRHGDLLQREVVPYASVLTSGASKKNLFATIQVALNAFVDINANIALHILRPHYSIKLVFAVHTHMLHRPAISRKGSAINRSILIENLFGKQSKNRTRGRAISQSVILSLCPSYRESSVLLANSKHRTSLSALSAAYTTAFIAGVNESTGISFHS